MQASEYRLKGSIIRLVSAAALTWFAPQTLQAQTIVNTCGQVVSGKGVLSADLDCTGFPAAAVTLTKGAKLDLAGFTLTGGDADAIFCEHSCTVLSSSTQTGVVQNATGSGIGTFSNVCCDNVVKRVVNVRITGNGGSGVSTMVIGDQKVVIKDSEITSNGLDGATGGKKLSVKRSTISNNGFEGVRGSRVSIVDSEINGNQASGADAFGLRCRRSSLSGNQIHGAEVSVQGDIAGVNLRSKDCTLDGNQLDGLSIGIAFEARLSISGGSLSNNGRDGLGFQSGAAASIRSRAKLVGTVVTENGANGVRTPDSGPLYQLLLRKATVSDNGANGVSGRFVDKGLRVVQSEVTDNGIHGIEHLADPANGSAPCPTEVSRSAVVTGNGVDAACGVSFTCADVAGCDAPVVDLKSTCDTSYDTESGFPGSNWGVCALD